MPFFKIHIIFVFLESPALYETLFLSTVGLPAVVPPAFLYRMGQSKQYGHK